MKSKKKGNAIPELELDLPMLSFEESGGDLELPDLGLLPKEKPTAGAAPAENVDPVEATVEATKVVETILSNSDRLAKARFRLITDSEFWVCMCFETREQKVEFLRRLKLIDLGDKHIDGLEVAERLGVPLKSPRAKWPNTKGFGELAKLAKDE